MLVYYSLIANIHLPNLYHIFKTLTTISTIAVCCDPTVYTIHVIFTQYAVNYHVSKIQNSIYV